MGRPSQFPAGPLTSQIAAARTGQFRRLAKAFIRQFSQPQLLALAEAHLGEKALHSTHLSGFSKGLLQDPGPKGFVALGLVNVALGEGKLPGSMRAMWEGKVPMRGPKGELLGPTDLFAVFTGLLDLGLDEVREIPGEQEVVVAKKLGKWLRMSLSAKGVDWGVEEAQRLKDLSPTIEALLWGRTPNGDEVVEAIPLIAEELGIGEGEVWDEIERILGEESKG